MSEEEMKIIFDNFKDFSYLYGPIKKNFFVIMEEVTAPHNLIETKIGCFLGTDRAQSQFDSVLLKKPPENDSSNQQ